MQLAWVRRNPILAALVTGAIVIVTLWSTFALTPSSYAGVLQSIGAQETGLLAGAPRAIRADEWSVLTPYFQAAVRNGFARFNQTSFYDEDLRNINALPLKDWGMVFKPQLWPFFLLPPANAFGCYFGLLMAAFLVGYFLLFRALNFEDVYAVTASLLLFCCGFVQFWWTSSGPSLCFFPWAALAFLRPYSWWLRIPLCAYAVTVWVIACGYPILILSAGFGFLVLLLALRRDTLRSPAMLATAAAGGALAGLLVYVYFGDVIRAMSQTVYPGDRRAPPGSVPLSVVWSQIWPAFTFRTAGFQNLVGLNICEIGAAGSFLPLLTLCAIDFSRLRKTAAGKEIAIVAAGVGLMTWWMAGQCPIWIGRLFYWNRFPADRLLYVSGLLLLTASLLIWQRGGAALTPLRAAVFVVLGPVAAALAKMNAFGFSASAVKIDWLCAALAAVGALATIRRSPASAARVMFGAVVAINAILFLRFNPLQSADPIFNIPDSNTLEILKMTQDRTPGAYLAMDGYRGAVLNGLGLRSVAHQLISPRPEFFRRYFPGMDEDTFNFVFNRYAAVTPKDIPLPRSPFSDMIEVPAEVFRPILNQRRVAIEQGDAGCKVTDVNPFGLTGVAQGRDLKVEGWAPWSGESDKQVLLIRSRRALVAGSLTTLRRPDIAESLRDYRKEKAGFRVVLAARDQKPLSLEDLRLAAEGTESGPVWLDGCPEK